MKHDGGGAETKKVAPNGFVRWWRDLTLPFILRHFAKDETLAWLVGHQVAWETPIG